MVLKISINHAYYQVLHGTSRPWAVEIRAAGAFASIHERPDSTSHVVGKLEAGFPAVAYAQIDHFVAVATPGEGHAGFVYIPELRTADFSLLPRDLDAEPPTGLRTRLTTESASSPSAVRLFKDPELASTLAFICPGCGHIYVGEEQTGLLLFLGAIVPPVIGAYMTETEVVCSAPFGGGCTTRDSAHFRIGLAVGLGVYFYSLFDSARAARRYNERRGVRLVSSRVGAFNGVGLAYRF